MLKGVFNPSRFFDNEGKLFEDEQLILFSIGKRICPGQNLANVDFSSILQVLSTSLIFIHWMKTICPKKHLLQEWHLHQHRSSWYFHLVHLNIHHFVICIMWVKIPSSLNTQSFLTWTIIFFVWKRDMFKSVGNFELAVYD